MVSATVAPAMMAVRRSSAAVATISGATMNSEITIRPDIAASTQGKSSHKTATAIATCPVDGRDRENRVVRPDFVVDVSAAFERKRAMLADHASQREWLRWQHGIDEYLGNMARGTRERGALAGVAYGEGFRQYRGQPYPQTGLLQELLEGAVAEVR